MWIYEQVSGWLSRGNVREAQGYSGAPASKNDPAFQDVPDIGPIPCGDYIIGEPIDSPKHGPFALPLRPDPDNQMFGRSEFLIHGDSLEHPGAASEGCVIMPRSARVTVWGSGDRLLRVVDTLSNEDNVWPNS